MKKVRREPPTYKEIHNKTLERFKKSSRLIIWAGVLNVISLLISIIQFATIKDNLYFYFCFGCNDLIFRSLMYIPNFVNKFIVLYFIVIVLIAILTTSLAVILGVFGSQGKKKALWGSLIFYTIDTTFIIPCIFIGESTISIILMSVLHIAILLIIIFAVYEYYKIIEIAKRYGVLKESEGSSDASN